MKIIATFQVEIQQHNDVFQTAFYEATSDTQYNVVTEKFDMADESARRQALDGMFHVIGHILRKKAFPADTMVYRTEKFPNGSAKSVIVGFPDGVGKKLQPA